MISKGFILYKNGKIPFVIRDYRMELFSDDSRELVKQYSSKKMDMKAYDDVSQRTSNIAAQQKIAEGIRDNGLGNSGGMVYGMNIAQNLGPTAETKSKMSLDEQIELSKA